MNHCDLPQIIVPVLKSKSDAKFSILLRSISGGQVNPIATTVQPYPAMESRR